MTISVELIQFILSNMDMEDFSLLQESENGCEIGFDYQATKRVSVIVFDRMVKRSNDLIKIPMVNYEDLGGEGR